MSEIKIKPFLFIPSPRDIPEFLEATSRLKIDKFWVKYNMEITAYNIARDKFLKQETQYTHFVILPDDLIVTEDNLNMLLADLEQQDYPILSGITNIDTRSETQGKYAICLDELPSAVSLPNLKYHWMWEYKRKALLLDNPIQKVMFSSFPLMFIRRDIVERVPFKYVSFSKCCIDVQFCWDCYYAGIPIRVDLRVVGKHLKKQDGVYEYFFVGVKNPVTRFEKYSAPTPVK